MVSPTRVQKKGRVTGASPPDDARVIDQFMDDVVNFISTSFSDGSLSDPVFGTKILIQRRISQNLGIINETVCVQRDPIVNAGVTITIQTGGELYIL